MEPDEQPSAQTALGTQEQKPPIHADDPRLKHIAEELMQAKAAQARSLTLEDTYIQYVTFANAGGIAACLGIADVLAGKTGAPLAAELPATIGPMALFFIGLIASGVTLSLRSKQALHEAEETARRANHLLEGMGHGVTLPHGAFSPLEVRVLPYLNKAVNAAGLVAQFAFLFGGIWGLHHIWTLR
ncbi:MULTISPECIES: hypothetical protein [unclassified Acidocella]|uniref:hypothetical protein n=1 Tax=unclassified Acidocella TaxID=2648610 RepID=UPI00028D2A86|nr:MULTISPECIES: hypothetical protein [unclassified Acidocella]EKN01373.1 hypothetical protein MXAZACID_00717 [Acidocella sp. MX-AZ02]WBO60873.1 hypothetical protein GT370_09165 [Acidocella sp. MX-AZ03]